MFERIRKSLFRETYRRGIDPARLSFVKRCGGDFSAQGRAVFEIFQPGSEDPVWVAKCCRSPQGSGRLAADYDRHRKVYERASEDLQSGLPEPLLFEDHPTGAFSVETFLPGQKLSFLFRSGGEEDLWRNWKGLGSSALLWLNSYGEAVGLANPSPPFADLAASIERELLGHRDRLARVLPDAGPLLEAFSEAAVIDHPSLRVFEPHGDFTPGNLIAMEGGLGVIDWSAGDTVAPPLLDLFHFLLSSAIYLERGLGGGSRGVIRGSVLAEERFWKPVLPEIRTALQQVGARSADCGPLLRAAFRVKLLGYLRKPRPVEASLRDWLGLLESGALQKVETRLREI